MEVFSVTLDRERKEQETGQEDYQQGRDLAEKLEKEFWQKRRLEFNKQKLKKKQFEKSMLNRIQNIKVENRKTLQSEAKLDVILSNFEDSLALNETIL